MFQVLEDAWAMNPGDAQKTFDLISARRRSCSVENTTNAFRSDRFPSNKLHCVEVVFAAST
jgi:hypothetical protein